MSTTFGAPFGACTGCGNCGGSESRYVRPTLPGKWKSGLGSTLGVLPVGAGSSFLSWARAGVSRPEAVSQPSRAPTVSTVEAARVVRVRIVRFPRSGPLLLGRVDDLPVVLHIHDEPP